MRKYTLTFPPGTKLINVNNRENRYARAKTTKALREMARVLAVKQKIPQMEKARVTAAYFPPDRRRRDSSNILFLSAKAALDGLTDAGIWQDDNDKIVVSLELLAGDHIVPEGQMVITIEEVRDD